MGGTEGVFHWGRKHFFIGNLLSLSGVPNGTPNMVFTSNKNPALWREDFNEDSTLLCALDRIFDEATVFKLRGESFRGKKLDTVSVQTGKVKAVELLADQQEE